MPGFDPVFELSSLNGANGFQINGEAANDLSGFSVASAGDVNGDGFDDLIIGAFGAEPNGYNSGASYVVFGQVGGFAADLDLSTLDGTNGFQISGETDLDRSGFSVASAGDVNGDGFDDLIIGADGTDANGVLSGASYVVFGQAGGFAADLDLSTLDGTNGFQISGETDFDHSGTSVASAGDVNGDGFDDLIIGAPSALESSNDVRLFHGGASYVVFGQAGAFTADIDLSTLDGTNGFQISGDGGADESGSSVASAGDVNGDGFDDLIIGAPFALGIDYGFFTGASRGASYVVFGKAGGFAADIDLSALDGTDGFQISGEVNGDFSGGSVASAGDVNGDGFDDLIIGADGADANGVLSGASYVVFGQAGGFAADLDLSTLDGTNGFQISGEAASDGSGHSVASAGDVNGDGFDDLIIGAPSALPISSDHSYFLSFRGASYVVFGQAGGFAADIDLSALDGTDGFQISGEADNADGGSGWSVASAGDVNGDGFDDLIIGAFGAEPNGYDSGASYVVFGQATAAVDRIGTNDADLLVGGDFDDTLDGRGGNDILDGRGGNDHLGGGGGADTMAGGAGDDSYVVDNAGDVVSEDGGGGSDTVQSSITFKLGGGFNNLTLTGSANINGTGTNSVNTLTGNAGNNKLDGRGGADTMSGGAGNDTYVVDNAGDVVSEDGGGGSDTVQSSITFKLGGGFNNLTLTGSSNINGTGTGSDNILKGNTGRNTLNGGGGEDVINGGDGNDRLIGGADADVFIFGDNDGADVITDFENGSDLIDLSAVDDVSRFSDLDITDTGGGVLIDYGNGTIELDDITNAASIGRGDFIFA